MSRAATLQPMASFQACAKVQVSSGTNATIASPTLGLVTSTADSLYEAFRTGERARVDRHPSGVFFAQSEQDVVNAVTCAFKAGLRVVPRGGSHSYEGFSSQDGSLVVDMSEYHQVKIVSKSGDSGVATVQAGARLGNVYIALAKEDFNFNAGTCPSVGIGGHIGGGGYGMLARYKGLAADQTLGMRVVLYNGTLVTASATEHPDLYWALRGGNAGSWGVVTEYTINVFKTPKVTMFRVEYDDSSFPGLVDAFMKNMLTVDKRLTVQLQMSPGSLGFWGQFTAGNKTELQSILTKAGVLDNTALKIKSIDFQENCSLVGLKAYTNTGTCDPATETSIVSAPIHLDPTKKDYGKYKANYGSKPMPLEGAQAISDAFKNAPDSSATLQFEILGGAVGEKEDSATPYSNRKSLFSMQYWVSLAKGADSTAPGWVWIKSLEKTLEPYVNSNHYQNYPDLDIGSDYGNKYYGAANFAKLKQLKAKYDPQNIFRNEQSIPLP